MSNPSNPQGFDPDAYSPFGADAPTAPAQPQVDPSGFIPPQPTGPAPEGYVAPVAEPAQAGDSPVPNDAYSPFQTDYTPGGEHASDPAEETQHDSTGAFQPSGTPYADVNYADAHYAPVADAPARGNKVSPVLVGVCSVLVTAVLGGGGFYLYQQNEVAKAEQAAKIAQAESEAQAAKDEAKKAQEASKKAAEAQEAAAKQAAEAEKKAAEEAAKAEQAEQAAQAAQANPVAPAPAAPAAPAPAPGGAKRKGLGVRPAIKDTQILGSGCQPGTDHLPNGTWFGFAYDKGNDIMDFDLVCLSRTGNIDNQNDKLRRLNANGFQYPESSFVGITVENGTITNLWLEGS